MIEIERKFLVNRLSCLEQAVRSYRIAQGYLSTDPARTVRVRTKDDKGFLTIKGVSSDDGSSRYEWEKEISLADALELLKLALPEPIYKVRHLIPAGKHTFEVDVFEAANSGLIIAEIELERADEPFERPDWLGEEVTGDARYYNAFIAENPFNNW